MLEQNKQNKEDNKLIGKKRKIRKEKESDEKKINVYEHYGQNENIKEEKVFKTLQEFDSYLSSLKKPFYIDGDRIIELNTPENKLFLFKSKILNKVYQKEDSSKLYDDYQIYQYLYINSGENSIKTPNPFPLKNLLIGPNFFFDLPNKNCPQFYRSIDEPFPHLLTFLGVGGYFIFHLYMRKKCGSTLYLMKQMERKHEGFIYLDFRKLNDIILTKENSEKFNEEFKKFIYFSLFNLESIYSDAKEGFEKIENYYYYILNKIHINLPSKNDNNFFKILLNSYIDLYKKYFHKNLLNEFDEQFKMIIIIIDHYNHEFENDFINKIIKENEDGTLQFLIKHSLNTKNEIEELFYNIDNADFKPYNTDFYKYVKGIEVIKDKIIVGFYKEMYPFDENNFDGIELLKLYKNELKDNFGLINPNYFYKFIEYMKDKNIKTKDLSFFTKFLKIITTEIELDIRYFYNNSLENENFFISKYYNINFQNLDKAAKKKIDFIKKNLPLNYFILKYSPGTKEIIDIKPSCNLVQRILEKKSKNFASIIYQSKYYEEANKGEQGNILQRAIEEKLKNEPSILLNHMEKTLVFELEYLIPSCENISSEKSDPVINYYNAIHGLKKGLNQDIEEYITDIEKNDMKKLSAIIKKNKGVYNNIILIEKEPKAKNYDLGIIKFTNNNFFVLLLFQITVTKEDKKFQGINKCMEYDIAYIIAKIENFLKGYKSEDVHLIYVLDKNEEIESNKKTDSDIKQSESSKLYEKKISSKNKKEKQLIETIVNYKKGLKNLYENKVHLLYYGRKYLKFYTEKGKIIKELSYINQNINFETSDINHYFLNEYVQHIFNKIISIFNIEVGKFYFDYYDYDDMIGDCLIITKISSNHITVVININGKKLHLLEVKENKIAQVKKINYNEKESYFFEIINPNDINSISLFSLITLDK